MKSSAGRIHDSNGKLTGWAIDAVAEPNDVIEIRTYLSASGQRNLVIDLNGITLVRIGMLTSIPKLQVES